MTVEQAGQRAGWEGKGGVWVIPTLGTEQLGEWGHQLRWVREWRLRLGGTSGV